MTLAAAVVRWAVVVVVWGTAQGTSLVDLSRCTNSCSAVPEDLWPSCCEAHGTCCEEFADSCMHDCLPRVHTGDVSVVEERPGMCCALYNLCCFRETFRISSKRRQEPATLPILHRFNVQPPSGEPPSSRPPKPRPSSPAQDSSPKQDQDSPKRPGFLRPQVTKKQKSLFRPNRPDGLKKLSGSADDNVEEPKKLRGRLMLPSILANRYSADTGNPTQLKVTSRPAGSDIRQEVAAHEVGRAEAMGARRLDASINPVVTRKRLLVSTGVRQGRREGRKQEAEQEANDRKPQGPPAREGRRQGGGRSALRPATSGKAQVTTEAGQENSRSPKTRRPVQAAPTPSVQPSQDATPTLTVRKTPKAAPQTVQTPEPVKESQEPAAKEEAKEPMESTVSDVKDAPDTPLATPSTPAEQTPVEEKNPTAAASQAEEVMEKAPESPTEAAVETEAETALDAAEPEEAPAKTAFMPPEIVVDIPEEPKVETPSAKEEAVTGQSGGSRSRKSGGAAAAKDQRTRSGEQTRGRGRGQTGDRTASRTADQAAVRGASDTTRQTEVRGHSRARSRPEAEEATPPQATSRARG